VFVDVISKKQHSTLDDNHLSPGKRQESPYHFGGSVENVCIDEPLTGQSDVVGPR